MRISADIHKSNTAVFAIVMILLIPAVFFPVRWYSSVSSSDQHISITVSGAFRMRGYMEVYSHTPGQAVQYVEKVHFTGCNGTQNINLVLPVADKSCSFFLQFSHLPSDSFKVESLTYKTTYSNHSLHLKRTVAPNAKQNIIIAPAGINKKMINKKTKNSFVIASPYFKPVYHKQGDNEYLFAFIIYSLILISSITFYKHLHILSYSYIIISALLFVITCYLIRDVGFRSFISSKTTSSPVIEMGMVVPLDDRIVMYWDYENKAKMQISDDNKVSIDVNGSPDLQHFTFALPDETRAERFRLYLGKLPIGNREIHYFRFRRYDKVIDIPPSSMPSFFTLLYNVGSYKLNDNFINIPINDQNSFIETQNEIGSLLEPVYTYEINKLSGYYLSLILSVLFFFWLYFSSFTDKLAGKEKEINL